MTAWTPKYTLTPAIARGLMQIEAARALVDHTPLTPAAEAEIRARARVRAAHFSTFIEGNRLTLEEAKQVIADEHAEIAGRERDVLEVRREGFACRTGRAAPPRSPGQGGPWPLR
jgi:Fic family protein